MARKLIGQNIQTHWVTRAGLEGIGALHGLTFAPISPIPVRNSPEKIQDQVNRQVERLRRCQGHSPSHPWSSLRTWPNVHQRFNKSANICYS